METAGLDESPKLWLRPLRSPVQDIFPLAVNCHSLLVDFVVHRGDSRIVGRDVSEKRTFSKRSLSHSWERPFRSRLQDLSLFNRQFLPKSIPTPRLGKGGLAQQLLWRQTSCRIIERLEGWLQWFPSSLRLYDVREQRPRVEVRLELGLKLRRALCCTRTGRPNCGVETSVKCPCLGYKWQTLLLHLDTLMHFLARYPLRLRL